DRGLTDVVEAEPNNDPQQAQEVTVNCAVAGTSDGNNVDQFRFAAQAGQRILIDCRAGRLDSQMDATMTLAASDGRLLASSSDHNGRDPQLDFAAPAAGEYVVRVYDLSYRGGFPYRLVITDQPHVETVFPRAVQTGQQVELLALGRNLGGATASDWSEGELQYQQRTFPFRAGLEVGDMAGGYRFQVHPTDHSVLPTAATCTLTGMQFQAPDSGLAQAHPILVADSATTLESEPNDSPDQASAVQLPLVVSGRFDRPRDADWYQFEVPESGQYGFDVYCERINGRADPYLVIVDDQGNRINELDDFGHRINAFDGHLRDPAGMVNLTEKRTYKVLVQDRYRRGGARYQYVLAIRRQQPDFYVAVIHSQNPGPGGTTVWKGGSVYLDVVVHQQHGFNDPITITAEDLPPGLSVAPTVINNNSRGTLVLTATDDAADFVGPIRLIATARTGSDGDTELRREVRSYARVWNQDNSSRPMREHIVAIRDSAPYRLEWQQDRLEVEPGKTAEARLRLIRRWPEFDQKVTIQPLAFAGNFKLANTDLTGQQTELTLPIEVQNGTRPGEYTMCVLGQAQVPFNKDPDAKDRPNTLVSLPSMPLTLVVNPPADKAP
ncbi:MAG: PPC domain-containing protein, partial [Planctomycetales bacterium]|nr:PPC domain-containing protein [Planctomycetales bacterium]